MLFSSIVLVLVLLFVLSLFVHAGLLYLVCRIFKLKNFSFQQSLAIIGILFVIGLVLSIMVLKVNVVLAQIFTFVASAFVFTWLLRKYYLTVPWRSLLIYISYQISVLILGVIVAIIILIPLASMYSPFIVEGESMQPTYQTGDYVVADKLTRQYKDGDVIIYQNDEGVNLIKRIIANPGDRLEIVDGHIKVNNQRREYNEIQQPIGRTVDLLLGQNQYYVIGDNANHSSLDGVIEASQITGEVVLKLFGSTKN